MHSVRAYKTIFAVLERQLIQLLINWLQFFIIIFAVLLIILLIILLFVIEHCLFMFVQIKCVQYVWYVPVVFSSNFYHLTFNMTTRIVSKNKKSFDK